VFSGKTLGVWLEVGAKTAALQRCSQACVQSIANAATAFVSQPRRPGLPPRHASRAFSLLLSTCQAPLHARPVHRRVSNAQRCARHAHTTIDLSA